MVKFKSVSLVILILDLFCRLSVWGGDKIENYNNLLEWIYKESSSDKEYLPGKANSEKEVDENSKKITFLIFSNKNGLVFPENISLLKNLSGMRLINSKGPINIPMQFFPNFDNLQIVRNEGIILGEDVDINKISSFSYSPSNNLDVLSLPTGKLKTLIQTHQEKEKPKIMYLEEIKNIPEDNTQKGDRMESLVMAFPPSSKLHEFFNAGMCVPDQERRILSFSYQNIKNDKIDGKKFFLFKFNKAGGNLMNWPAIENNPIGIFFDLSSKFDSKMKDGFFKFLKEFGFDIDLKQDIIMIPSFEFFTEKWKEEVKDLKISLKEMEFILEDGIAKDNDFINSFIKKKVIISNGVEFFHDMTVHVLPLLISLYAFKMNIKTENQMNDYINLPRDIIEILRKQLEKYLSANNVLNDESKQLLWMQLSLTADNVAAASIMEFTIASVIPNIIFDVYHDILEKTSYFNNRFNRKVEEEDFKTATEHWKKIMGIK